ncbi:unnamed protein product [Cunninghamella blakesleeana]
MSVLSSVSGFAAFGVLVRTYALGLQKRPLFSTGVFGSVGYYVYNLQEQQNATMEQKKELLLKNRARAEEIAQQQAAYTN